MSKGMKVKPTFYAVVTNYCGNLAMSSIILNAATCLAIGPMSRYKYLQTTILDYNKAWRLIPIPPKNFNNVNPS